ncbi:MAG: SGNH/GDSL hydrolase family protein [Ornithinimicrobium sp.]|uniref:SGNH/GDSL hydrolase family protein n=1 Tax=Ornithinimicrobium sp. TaxID=1977084 RepID=UPI0026DF363C|nr:SGNH/GDSL hydrolase family protein [Ornithinimicrobium sp.]MDO5738876.1 SGNH/GDSL hydrolase family protein [Ornithinimicrobium sp.]
MRWYDVGLGTLAVVTAALVVFTYRGVAQAPGTFTAEQPTSSVGDNSAVTSAAGDHADATTAAPRSSHSRITSVRTLLQQPDPIVIVALGDSTGNDSWEWPYEWARRLAVTRPVTVVPWDGLTEAGYEAPLPLSEVPQPGGPGKITLYVGHQDGATAAYPTQHLAELFPQAPDLVMLNYGHNNTVSTIEAELDQTLTALRDSFGPELPVILTLQQPQAGDANAQVRTAVHDFASEHALGWIDVAASFAEHQAAGEILMMDDVHPNEAGQALWADKVAAVLHVP